MKATEDIWHEYHMKLATFIRSKVAEDVVDDLEVQARRMIDFIGVDWEPQVLNFNQLDVTVEENI